MVIMTDTQASKFSKSPWSPHKAKLKRRREGAKPMIDFDTLLDEPDFDLNLSDSPKKDKDKNKSRGSIAATAAANKAAVLTTSRQKRNSATDAAHKATERTAKKGLAASAKDAAGVATTRAHKRLSAETAAMFAKLNDKNLPLRERVEIEVLLSKHESTRKLVAEMKYKGGRKSFLKKVDNEKLEQEQQIMNNLKEEEERKKQELKELQEKRDEELRVKRKHSMQRREMRKSIAEKISKDLEQVRLGAEKAAEAVHDNKAKRVEEEEEHNALKEELLALEETDVQRILKEAVLDQKGLKGQYDD